MHIYVLELKTIFSCNINSQGWVKNHQVKILTDSTTAVNYINNMGGVKAQQCNITAWENLEIWKENNIWISCAYILGLQNKADRLSREFKDDIEWTLEKAIVHRICAIWNLSSIDPFASRFNSKVTKYSSWRPEHFSNHVKAFLFSPGININ